jgi:folate-binding protein YgfZ
MRFAAGRPPRSLATRGDIMLHDSPLRKRHEAWLAATTRATAPETAAARPGAAVGKQMPGAEVEYISYGPPDEQGLVACEIVGTFGEVEAEYAAIRRAAGLVDATHRGTIRVTGGERRDFLNRMVTQELADLEPGSVRATFWLNRKGRIDADLLIVELGEEMLIDVDIHQAAAAATTLESFIFTEEIELADVSDLNHRIQVHGPSAEAVIARAAELDEWSLEPLRAKRATIAGVETIIVRRDQTGEVGLELTVPYDDAAAVWDALLATDEALFEGRRRIRPIGWFAFNIARIEAGTPLANVDFGATNLPHETGLLRERVSFTKGCYLGQEVVARTENLGRPKQTLVGLRITDDALPIAGAQVFARADDGMGDQIGVVTSSTLSPMLGNQPIAFAMLKSTKAAEGSTVLVSAEGDQVDAVVGPLRMWKVT